MKHYAVQKAQQALRELLKDAPLEERLNRAWSYLLAIDEKFFIEDADRVARAMKELTTAFDEKHELPKKASAVGHTIEAIFEEFGATEAMRKMAD